MTDVPARPLHPTGHFVPAELDEALVAAVVEDFYRKARYDPLLGPVFNRVIAADHWPEHIQTITDFWSALLLGTRRYSGRPLPRHLAIPELSDDHFQRWLTLFRETAEQACPPEIAVLFVERAERIGHNFRIRIAELRGGDPARVPPQRA
jgi:hemoglobin